jgi:fibro-slime domain-containing protein
MKTHYRLLGMLQIAVAAVLCVSTAYASSLSAFYYEVSTSDPDFGTQCCGLFTNMVQSTLGPNGLPVLNPTYGGPTIHDVNGSNELTWWSPSFNSHVTSTGTGTISLPFSNSAMYPPRGQNPSGGDSNGYLAAVFSGSLTIPSTESVTFTLGSDDDSFLYLNNTLVTSSGGVHADSPAPVVSQTLGAGTYSLLLFYDDRYPTQAALDFSVNTSNVLVGPPEGPSSGIPEPASVLLIAAGLLPVALVSRLRTAAKR